MPDPRQAVSRVGWRGGRKTSPWTSFQPISSSVSSWRGGGGREGRREGRGGREGGRETGRKGVVLYNSFYNVYLVEVHV